MLTPHDLSSRPGVSAELTPPKPTAPVSASREFKFTICPELVTNSHAIEGGSEFIAMTDEGAQFTVTGAATARFLRLF